MNFLKSWVLVFAGWGAVALGAYAQEMLNVSADLGSSWLVFDDGGYRPFVADQDAGTKIIYLSIDASQYHGQYLQTIGEQNPAIFINGQLIKQANTKKTTLSVDSLREALQASMWLVGIYQSYINPENLQVHLVSPSSGDASLPYGVRKPTYFSDFVIVGLLILLILFAMMMRMNNKLTSEYFSVLKVFTGQESEDAQLYTRTGGGSSILFHAFCCLILSFCMVIIFHYVGAKFAVAWTFRATTFAEAFLQWGKLFMILFMVFMFKISLIYVMSRFFGLSDLFGLHALNWLRLMLVASGLLTIVVTGYHISRGLNTNIYAALLWSVAWILLTWVIILFPKVVRRSGFSLFHIFSYLCATELIPLLVSIKLLYN